MNEHYVKLYRGLIAERDSRRKRLRVVRPPEPVANPDAEWRRKYADWYHNVIR